jgi:hypothetical protein
MHPELNDVWTHMVRLGTGALAHANRHAAYWGMTNNYWPELSVLQAAHAAELFIKARIAQEHPLLIFETLPRPSPDNTLLDMRALFEQGRTIQWSDLPARLWAVTGMTIENPNRYQSFGRLRNGLQHFSNPGRKDLSDETLSFIYEVIDPLINKCWGLYAIDYDEDDVPYEYLVAAVVRRRLKFQVSPAAAKCFRSWSINWKDVPKTYARDVRRRVKLALNPQTSAHPP